MTVSVVLIAKNQDWNSRRLIESILQGNGSYELLDVILVDSASSDSTIEFAQEYPIDVLRLRPDQILTPAAGRYVGYKRARGEFILFVDGDMELCHGWLGDALSMMQTDCTVGVATGQIVDVSPGETKPRVENVERSGCKNVSYCGGAALYRRSVLESVGVFNPYLYSEEEPELCLRIRHAGYRIVELQRTVVFHYSTPTSAFGTLVARWRRNLYLGAGQNIRYLLGTPLLWLYLKERGWGCVPALTIAAGLACFAWSVVTSQWTWFASWLLLMATVFLADSYRKRSFYLALRSVFRRVLMADGTVRGLLLRPMDPNTYPARFDIIKSCSLANSRVLTVTPAAGVERRQHGARRDP